MRRLVISLLLLFLMQANAETYAGKSEMNGIRYKTYDGFEDKWKMITVRYRTDTSEQRFVWANPIALKALEAGAKDYPDGAVFAKIGFVTEEDSAFQSSRVPSGALRYQFMVRDKKKYAATGGWGYALFDGNKTTYEENPTRQAEACYACHRIVPDRGQVFSTPLKISAFAKSPTTRKSEEPPSLSAIKFVTLPLAKTPEIVQRSLPKADSVRSVSGPLTAHVFRGTIDEIRPALIEEAKKTGLPAALIGDDGEQFSAVYLNPDKKDCSKGKSLKAVFSTKVPSNNQGASPYLVVAYQDLCL